MPSHRNPVLAKALMVSILLHTCLLEMRWPVSPRHGTPTEPVRVFLLPTARTEPVRSTSPTPMAIANPGKPITPASAKRRPPIKASNNDQPNRKLVSRPSSVTADPTPIPVSQPVDQNMYMAPTPGQANIGEIIAMTGTPPPEELHMDPRGKSGTGTSNDLERSVDDIQTYRALLTTAAQRFKRYPALARNRGWEGRAEVALEYLDSNPEPVVSLKTSCGKSILDDQALEMIRQAVHSTVIPETLKGKSFRLLLPVEFSLQDEG